MTPIAAGLVYAAETAAAAGLASGGWFYAALHPASQTFGRVVIAGTDPRELALTYDDGPNPSATPKLLETLAREDVKATFFLIGDFVRQQPALVREIAVAGHTIGNHTMTHPWLSYCGATRIRHEIVDSKAIIEDTIGTQISLFRPPHGARRPVVLEVAREIGLATVNWNVITHDWRPQQSNAIAAKVRNGVRTNMAAGRGSNVLLHDGGLGQPRMPSVFATETIIADARALGTTFVTPAAWV